MARRRLPLLAIALLGLSAAACAVPTGLDESCGVTQGSHTKSDSTGTNRTAGVTQGSHTASGVTQGSHTASGGACR